MMTSSNGKISALLAIGAENSPVPGEFPTQRPVTRSFDIFFDLHPNKRLSESLSPSCSVFSFTHSPEPRLKSMHISTHFSKAF